MHGNETVMNETQTMNNTIEDTSTGISTMGIVYSVIASVGLVTNLTVIVVFLNHRKLRRKIPNICIINQVCFYCKFRKHLFYYADRFHVTRSDTHLYQIGSYFTELRVSQSCMWYLFFSPL